MIFWKCSKKKLKRKALLRPLYERPSCQFAKMIFHWRIILAKYKLGHSYTFWTMPILIFSPVSNFGDQSLPCLTLVWNSWRFFMVGELVSKRNRWCCWIALAWSFGSKKGLVRSKKLIAKLMSICSKFNSKSPQVWFKVKLCCKISSCYKESS